MAILWYLKNKCLSLLYCWQSRKADVRSGVWCERGSDISWTLDSQNGQFHCPFQGMYVWLESVALHSPSPCFINGSLIYSLYIQTCMEVGKEIYWCVSIAYLTSTRSLVPGSYLDCVSKGNWTHMLEGWGDGCRLRSVDSQSHPSLET